MGYSSINARLQKHDIVLLDGGTGTELEKRGAAMHPEAWCGPATLDSVEILEGVHRDYISAGADIITANTYASSRLMLEPAGFADRFEEINRTAVAAAHRARESSHREDVLVAGSLSHMCPMAPGSDRSDPGRAPPADVMRDAFYELAALLRDAGCDVLILEMMYDPQRIPLALEAALATGLPVWVGFAVRRDEHGSIVSFAHERAIPLSEMISVLDGADVQAAGFMHSPADTVAEAVTALRQQYTGPIMAYPDSGYFRMPHWRFEDVIEPEVLVEFARDWVDGGVQILGGCCGLSPRHIAALREALLDD